MESGVWISALHKAVSSGLQAIYGYDLYRHG